MVEVRERAFVESINVSQDTNKGQKTGCPFCANQKVLVGFNDILTANPEIDEYWDFDNNDIGIYDCVASSRKKVFWKCYNNHTWIKSISSQINNNRCPI